MSLTQQGAPAASASALRTTAAAERGESGVVPPPPLLQPSPKRAAPPAYFCEKKLVRPIARRTYAGRGEGNMRPPTLQPELYAVQALAHAHHARGRKTVGNSTYSTVYCRPAIGHTGF